MPLTETEAQQLHEAGAMFASYTGEYRVAESDRLNAEVRGEKTSPGDRFDRAIESARKDWRKAHTRFHGLIDDLKEETP